MRKKRHLIKLKFKRQEHANKIRKQFCNRTCGSEAQKQCANVLTQHS